MAGRQRHGLRRPCSQRGCAGDLTTGNLPSGNRENAPPHPMVDEVFVQAAGTTGGEYTQLYEGIPAGTLCNISEPTSGANEDVTVESTFTGEVAILPGATQAAGVTNLYALVPVSERLPKTGAESMNLALMGGGAVIAGSMLVLASLRRRQS